MKAPRPDHGFTLIETLAATVVLVCGLTAAAALFSYSARTNLLNQQRAAANFMLHNKLEELKSESIDSAVWNAGGSLDPASPVTGFSDYPAGNGSFLRLWEITGSPHRTVTVVVVVQSTGLTRTPVELARGAARVTPSF